MIVWLWPYCPVTNVARDGQQSGKDAKLFVNVVPRAASSAFTFVMTRTDSTVWSSVITTTMFGRVWACEGFAGAEETREAESAGTASDAARTPHALGRLLAILLLQ